MGTRGRKSEQFGPCHCCGSGTKVRSLVMLEKKCPTPGQGWGCLVCGLPPDGAVSVLCDQCVKEKMQPAYAFKGYPARKEVVSVLDLEGEHKHDLAKHPEIIPRRGTNERRTSTNGS